MCAKTLEDVVNSLLNRAFAGLLSILKLVTKVPEPTRPEQETADGSTRHPVYTYRFTCTIRLSSAFLLLALFSRNKGRKTPVALGVIKIFTQL